VVIFGGVIFSWNYNILFLFFMKNKDRQKMKTISMSLIEVLAGGVRWLESFTEDELVELDSGLFRAQCACILILGGWILYSYL
jgi:hypothetical protein